MLPKNAPKVCQRCHRPLKSPQSQLIGMGWTCLSRIAVRRWTRKEITELAWSHQIIFERKIEMERRLKEKCVVLPTKNGTIS